MNGASCASRHCLDCCNSYQTIVSRIYFLHHCHSAVMWCLIAVLGQDNLTWMKIQLSGGPFASLLHTVKIVCGQLLPKKSCWICYKCCHLDRWLTEQSRQVRLRKTCKRCTYQEMPWTKTGQVIWIIRQSC